MRTLRRWIGMWLLCSVAAAHTASAATRYVAPPPAGDDANAGTQAAPWATLQKAANVVNAGDTVHVLDGSYKGFDLRRSGTAASPITFQADGASVRITADNGVTPDGINVENAAYVIVDGFIADGRTRAGIRVAVSQFVTVRHCHAGSNGRWGIFSGFADDLTIEDNETHHSIAEHGIYVSNSGDRPIIRRNVSHDNHANGIHMNGDASQGGDGTISGALVEANVIYGNGVGGGSGINMDGVTDSVVRNNLLYDNHASGISLYQIDGATGSTDNVVVNNTVINASNARWCINISGGSTGNHLRNNILYNYHSYRGAITIDDTSLPGFVSDYNSVMSRFSTDTGDTVMDLAAWQALGYDTHSFLALPTDHFVAPGTDFHLLASSPAIDAGTATEAPAVDLDGVARPQGARVDVGAYERVAAGPSPTPTFTPLPTVTRTPSPSAKRTLTPSSTATATRTATPTATRTGTSTATATATASVTPMPTVWTVGGTVTYYRGGAPVAGVIADLVGASPHTASSDAMGRFVLPGIPGGAWQLTPRKSGDRGGAVSALDAAYVLQHVADMRQLDAEQRLACDVTGNGTLSALDATRILQMTVGLLGSFPAADACGSDWLFVPHPTAAGGTPIAPSFSGGLCQPGSIDFATLSGDAPGQDFAALLIGDCTGNWRPSGAAGLRQRMTAVDVRPLRRVRAAALRSAIVVRTAAPMQALTFTLDVDPAVRLVSVRPMGSARGAALQFNRAAPGTYTVALAAAAPINGGATVVLEFSAPGANAASAGVRVHDVHVDE